MKKITLLLLTIAFWSFNLNAQTYLSEGFESGVPPSGWIDEAGSGPDGGNMWAQTGTRSNSGTNSAFFDDFNGNNDRWLITSVIDLSGATAPEFLYFDNVNFVGFANQHNVKYSTDYSGSGDPTAATWTDLNTVYGTEDTWVENGPYTLPTSATVYIAFQYVGNFASEWYIDDLIVREPLACTPPTATASVVDDCGNNQFSIDVNVTDMGDATTYTLSNDYDGGTVNVTGTGIWTAGPFPIGNGVTVTLEHDTDAACDTSYGTYFDGCPPINDDVCDAIAVTVDTGTTGGTYTNFAATTEGSEPTGSCWLEPVSESVWFTFVAPASGEIRISTKIGDGTLTDTNITLYSATDCSNFGTFVEVDCDDDDDNNIISATGLESVIQTTGLVSGNTYYVQVAGYDDNVGTFDLSIFDLQSLSVDEFAAEDVDPLSYFPNPVKDRLTLKAQENIQEVSVYNMLGQEVIRTTMSVQKGEIDMSSLQAGPYFVKAKVNGKVETLKVIKK